MMLRINNLNFYRRPYIAFDPEWILYSTGKRYDIPLTAIQDYQQYLEEHGFNVFVKKNRGRLKVYFKSLDDHNMAVLQFGVE